MRDLIATLELVPGARVEFLKDEAGIVVAECHMPDLPQCVIKISGSTKVLEWGLIIKDEETDEEIYMDWMDYTGYGETDIEKLNADMRRDIEWVLGDIRRATDFRVRSEKVWWILREKKPEWLIDGEWREAKIYDPHR